MLTKRIRTQLARLRRARELRAPSVIIKAEQVRLICIRDGVRFTHLNPSVRQEELWQRHCC